MRQALSVGLLLGLFAIGLRATAQDAAKDAAKDSSKEAASKEEGDPARIRKAIASYVAAFQSRDAKALAAHWSPEAVYISPLNGTQITGRDALEEEFTAQFSGLEGVKLVVDTESIEFVSPNVALETGSAIVVKPDVEPIKSTYRAVYVKRDGQWLIDRIHEEEEPAAPPSNYRHLKGLEWMIGHWIDSDGGSVIKTECNWTRNRNYLVRAFTASVGDRVNVTGMQLVGWDPAKNRIRSWVFDSDGGFASGTWSQRGDRWVVQTKATLSDGSLASSTSILKFLGDDRFSWQKVNRVVDGEILPNIPEIEIVRE